MTGTDAQRVDREEGFAAWLAMNECLVEEFVDSDVVGMPDDVFSEDGLRAAEAEALRRFPSPEDALAPENRELYDKFARYLGEVIVRTMGGRWTNQPLHDDGRAYLGISLPWRKEPLTVPTLVTAALARRTGEEWSFVYRSLLARRDG